MGEKMIRLNILFADWPHVCCAFPGEVFHAIHHLEKRNDGSLSVFSRELAGNGRAMRVVRLLVEGVS